LLAAIAGNRAAFEQIYRATQVTFMERVIENVLGYGANVYEQFGADRPASSAVSSVDRENRRDALNAKNIRWLIEEGSVGRKIIVWAHNAHVMNAYYGSDWRSVFLEPQADVMKPSGVFLADWLGRDVYTIGMTAYEGEDGLATSNVVTPIAPAANGGLESRLHRLGKPYIFLDFRALDGRSGHPLRAPQSMRIPKYEDETVPDVTRPYDAIFYIDRMARATRIGN
jgi:erythromycin esterase